MGTAVIFTISHAHSYKRFCIIPFEYHLIAELRKRRFNAPASSFVERKLVVTDYYNPELQKVAGLKIGDIISHINNEPVEAIIDSLKPYYPASNQAARL